MLEIKMGNRLFTWGNNQAGPVLATLYRFFCSTKLDQLFPLAIVKALPRLENDHSQVMWDGGLGQKPKSSSYKLKKWWLLRADFSALVEKSWTRPTSGKSALVI
jgi:hypothetical protein